MTITPAEPDSRGCILNRAQEDWDTCYSSGYGPRDFGNPTEWRQHVRTVNGDLRRVRQFISRASRGGPNQKRTVPKNGYDRIKRAWFFGIGKPLDSRNSLQFIV